MDLVSCHSFADQPTWCPGCGNFAVLAAVKSALAGLKLAGKDTVVTYDIGCGGNMVSSLEVCGFATLHGRSIPVAVGEKLANPDLTVIAQAGDGGLLNEGANHLIHTAQRNDNITVLLHNNGIFALTTGQASSATPQGAVTKSTPQGLEEKPLKALLLAASAGAGFLARTYAFDVAQTGEIIKQAINYQGFSLVEILMPCLIWSDKETQEQVKEKIFYISKTINNRQNLLKYLSDDQNDLALGVIWQDKRVS